MVQITTVGDLAEFVKDGDIVGIFGEAGAGKSSFTVRICNRLSERGYKIKYLSTDHPKFEIDMIIARWNANPEKFDIYDYFEEIRYKSKKIGGEEIKGIFSRDKEIIVIDSITGIIMTRLPYVTAKMTKIPDIRRVIEEIFSIIRQSGKTAIVTVDTAFLDRDIVKSIKEKCDLTIWIEDLGGKRLVVVEREGEEIFRGEVGYQGEILWK